jgi:hypothetical protein
MVERRVGFDRSWPDGIRLGYVGRRYWIALMARLRPEELLGPIALALSLNMRVADDSLDDV